ncbi:MAG: hypothetical protein ACYDG3_12115 [Bacillati bacterium]
MVLGLDGFAQANNAGSSTSQAVTFTTLHAGDVIIALVLQTSGVQSTVTDSNGLTWTLRKTITNSPMILEEWYAIWNGSGSITVTDNTSVPVGNVVIDLTAFAVSGSSGQFDPSPSFPSTGSTGVSVTSFTTPSYTPSENIGFIFGFFIANFGGASTQEPLSSTNANYSVISSDEEANGFSAMSNYRITSSIATDSQTVQGTGGSATWSTLIDVLLPAVPPTPPPTPSAASSVAQISIPSKVTPAVVVPIYSPNQLIGNASVPYGSPVYRETPVTAVKRVFKNGKYLN